MNSMQSQVSSMSTRGRQFLHRSPPARTNRQRVSGPTNRPETDIIIPLEKLLEAASAYWEAPVPSRGQAAPGLPSWSPRSPQEDFDATGSWALEASGPSLQLFDTPAAEVTPRPVGGPREIQPSRRFIIL